MALALFVGSVVLYLAAVGIALMGGRIVLRRSGRFGLAMITTAFLFIILLAALAAAGVPIPTGNRDY